MVYTCGDLETYERAKRKLWKGAYIWREFLVLIGPVMDNAKRAYDEEWFEVSMLP